MASRRSRERANARPWATGVVYDNPDQRDVPCRDDKHDDTERCPNTGDMFDEDDDDGARDH